MKSVLLAACSLAALGALPAHAQAPDIGAVVVTARQSVVEINQLPETSASIQAADIARTINAATVEDGLKLLPNVLIRQRHPGDTQDPITTRTSGVGASARSLVYVDGVLLSALIGNNNSSASPRWGMVAPGEVQRIDVMYGPFSAAFAGNSIGEVVQITTRRTEHLEAEAQIQGAWQDFSLYGTRAAYATTHGSAALADRLGPLSFRIDLNRLVSHGQPLAYATATVPAALSPSGTPVSGAFADANRLGQPIQALGAAGLEAQTVDTAKLKLTYDLTPTIELALSLGYFAQSDAAGAQSFLTDASGAPVYAGSLNIAGRAYTIAPSAFSANTYHLKERHLAQSLSAASHTGGAFDWEAVVSQYRFDQDTQNNPTAALPLGAASGPGAQTSLGGTGWITGDVKGFWQPQGAQQFSFGLHADRFALNSPKSSLSDWRDGQVSVLASLAAGKTETEALWAQDRVALAPQLTLTVGLRGEHWRAFDGVNYSASPALNLRQPSLSAQTLSPKAVLMFQPDANWRLSASLGQAYRFPTVSELYQAIATGPTLTSPNPNLKPEAALSAELSAERMFAKGRLRVSYFEERIDNALLSQTAPLASGSATLFTYVQNIPRTFARGVEIVGERDDLLIKGLRVSGWISYVDARTVSDPAFPAAQGKLLPQVPHLRGAFALTYSPHDRLSLTLDGRYSDRAHGVIDNSDSYANTYQGFSGYFVLDAKLSWRVDDHIDWTLGVDNLNNRKYFLFHPFPQRTVSTALSWRY